MAANAIGLNVQGIDIYAGIVRLSLGTIFNDDAIDLYDIRTVLVEFLPTATPAQIEKAIIDAMIAAKNEHYPAMSLARNGCIFFDVKRGV